MLSIKAKLTARSAAVDHGPWRWKEGASVGIPWSRRWARRCRFRVYPQRTWTALSKVLGWHRGVHRGGGGGSFGKRRRHFGLWERAARSRAVLDRVLQRRSGNNVMHKAVLELARDSRGRSCHGRCEGWCQWTVVAEAEIGIPVAEFPPRGEK